MVKVPIGTVVYRAEAPIPRNDDFEETVASNGEIVGQARRLPPIDDSLPAADAPALPQDDASNRIADLTHDGEEFILCQGGGGGKGNVHFKSSRNRAPSNTPKAKRASKVTSSSSFRTMADAALVGYPNAGKSTLLGKFPPRIRRSRRILSPRCIRSLG